MVLAVTDASALMRLFTRFTDEIFAALIAVIFIVEATTDIAQGFDDPNTPYDAALLGLVLALGTFILARTLQWFRNSAYLRWWMRDFLADFGPAIAIVAMTVIAILMHEVPRNHAQVPEVLELQPGDRGRVGHVSLCPPGSGSPPWFPRCWRWCCCFFDQNITTRLVNAKHHKLKKGSGYHQDLFVVGLIVLVESLFGLPSIVAATVHSLNHVRSLASHRVVETDGQSREEIVSVRENRMSPCWFMR